MAFVQCIMLGTGISKSDTPMDLDEMRTFVAIARCGSFSRAAAQLHRSQPAISRRIDLLETECGLPLLERLPGGARLTDAGTALLPFAEAMLAAAQDAAAAVRAVREGGHGAISVAMAGTLATTAFADMLGRFRRNYPDVRRTLATANSEDVSELVRRGDATIGLRYLEDSRSGLVSRIVAREALIVVCAAAHRLPSGKRLTPRDLMAERWVAFPARGSRESFVRFLERRLLAVGIEEPEITAIDSLTAQKRLVEAGFGLALLAESGVREELELETLRKLDVPALRSAIPVSVVYRRTGYLSEAARALLSAIADTAGA
jgi:DNA-binding transcriptional LysR family regulator